MEEQTTSIIEVTIEDILATFKSFSDEKKMKEIKDLIVISKHPDGLFVPDEEILVIHKQVEQLIREDKGLGNESYLKYNSNKRIYSKRPNRTPPGNKHPQQTGYIGTAGECAVISELLFAGYNANRMMLDEGVDIIATKNNIYYYIQVKTTFIDNNGRIYVKIDSDRFFQQQNIHYIFVARYFKDGAWQNMYFSFTTTEIQSHMCNGCISKGSQYINIKIKFHPRSGDPYLYNDSKESQCSFNWKRKDLLQPNPIQ